MNISKIIEKYELPFRTHVFEEFQKDKFQNIRTLLYTTKYADKASFKEQIIAYSKVIEYLKTKREKELKFSNDVFLPTDIANDESNKFVTGALKYLKTHIDERIVRYLNIIDLSNRMINYLSKKSGINTIEELFNDNLLNDIMKMNDSAQMSNFLKAIFRMVLRATGSEDNKLKCIKDLLKVELNYSKSIKCLYLDDSKPVVVKNVSQLMKVLGEQGGSFYYRGHSSCDYKMIPSVYREGLFYFEDDMIKEMMLELPDDFPQVSTHYEKLMKMQHYGIPTKLLDVTSNPLVALFMASDGDESVAGEVLMIKQDSFDECYPASDKVKILTSIPFLPFSTKIILAYFLDQDDMTDQLFNHLAKPLLHEIKHEMPAFEARMRMQDLKKHLFVLGPRSNKRIYAQSGHFIIAPLSLKFFSSTPVNFVESKGARIRIIIPAKEKQSIINELKMLNISRSTMYPEIEYVANEVKNQYL